MKGRGKFIGCYKGVSIAFEVYTTVAMEFVSGQRKLAVPAADSTVTVRVLVNLDRNGAQMFVDNKRVGDAPDYVTATPGVHHLRLI